MIFLKILMWIGIIGIILLLISIFVGMFRKHREVWDDIPNIKMQEELNKTRKKMGLNSKEIDYTTGMIK
jgi:hypothetical protein